MKQTICRWDDASMIIINLNAVHECQKFSFELSALPQIQIGNTLIRALSVCFNILFIFVWSNLTHLWSLINNIVYDSINVAGSWYATLNRIASVEKDPYIDTYMMQACTRQLLLFQWPNCFFSRAMVSFAKLILFCVTCFFSFWSLIFALLNLLSDHWMHCLHHMWHRKVFTLAKHKSIEHGTPKIEHWMHQTHMYYPNGAIDWGKIRF